MHTVTRKLTARSLIVGEGRTRPADGVVVPIDRGGRNQRPSQRRRRRVHVDHRGGMDPQHAEGIVVSTAITAGAVMTQHAEGVVVSTSVAAGGIQSNHSEGFVARACPPRPAAVPEAHGEATRAARRARPRSQDQPVG